MSKWYFVAGIVVSALANADVLQAQESGQRVPPEALSVSLIQLIASPAEYEGKRVAVAGFCNLAFEGNALYLHEEDFRKMLRVNAVRLDLPTPIPSAYQKAHWKYAMVEGVFSAPRPGAPGYRGRIHSITRLEAIP